MKILLYISYAYPPQEGIASLRASRMVGHLQKHGYRCAVLCGNVLHGLVEDPTIVDLAWRTTRVGFLDPAVIFSPLRRKMNRNSGTTGPSGSTGKKRALLRQIKQNLLPLNLTRMPGRRLPWIPGAALAFLRTGIRPDAIFTSSSPPACAMLGAFFSRRFNVPWIAEFRDLWSQNPVERLWPPLARMDEAIERRVLSRADMLATVSEELAESLKGLHHKPVLILPNGHDRHEPLAATHRRAGDPVHILHGGSLYMGRRDPTILLKAVKQVAGEGIKARVTFIGHDAVQVAGRIAGDMDMDDLVTCLGPLPHEEYSKMMDRADALAVIEETSQSAAGNATGKLFEYVGMRRPILAVAPVGGAIDRILRRTGLGRAVTTSGEMADDLRALAAGKEFQPVEDQIRALSRKAIAGRLAHALDELVKG
ncbi:MAG: glycosyltransferase family 4 protein [Deltaproteobacteria bacterium]|nr:glycosyltransferase family 4 protein [Deltaproteobacteria bacterium]